MCRRRTGQISVDLMIAMAIFTLAVTYAVYTIVSTYYIQKTDFDEVATAYRISLLLAENPGLNVSYNSTTNTYYLSVDWQINGTINSSSANWLNSTDTSIKRIGLADTMRIATGRSYYEMCIPCVLNKTKVENFFNESWWNVSWRFKNQSGFKLYRNLSVLMSANGYKFHIYLTYLNGTKIYDIGYPLPEGGSVVKFVRLVILDDTLRWLDQGHSLNSSSLRLLEIYVWK